jgi:hypothetical protein
MLTFGFDVIPSSKLRGACGLHCGKYRSDMPFAVTVIERNRLRDAFPVLVRNIRSSAKQAAGEQIHDDL